MSNQNGKPGWDKAPKGCDYLAQDSDGEWVFHYEKPELHDGPRGGEWFSTDDLSPYIHGGHFGKVEGDWRDTLETRPPSNKT